MLFFETETRPEYSVEYQVRLDDNMSSLSNYFLELMAYRQLAESLLLNGGYRFTIRTDHPANGLSA